MSQSSRRNFLKRSAQTTAAVASAPYWSWSENTLAASSQDRMKIGCIGLGGKDR
jgi:hypothetical protein